MGLGYGCSASFQIAEYRDDFGRTEIGAPGVMGSAEASAIWNHESFQSRRV